MRGKRREKIDSERGGVMEARGKRERGEGEGERGKTAKSGGARVVRGC